MRILLAVHQFVPDFRAGTEILAFSTAKALQGRGHEVRVFSGFPGRSEAGDAPRFDSYVHEGISVERFHHVHAPMGGETNVVALEYNNPFFAAYFRTYLTKVQPDVVHFFHLQRLSAAAIDVCHELGIATVLTPTDFWLVCRTGQLLLPGGTLCQGPDPQGVNCLRHVAALGESALAKVCLRLMPDRAVATLIRGMNHEAFPWKKTASRVRAVSERQGYIRSRLNRVDRVAVPTRLMEAILRNNGLGTPGMRFVSFGINTDGLSRRHSVGDEPRLRVAFMGTLSEHKGVHVLLQAVRSLSSDVPLEVRIYGNGNEYPQYVERLHKLAAGDSRIAFCGTFPNERIGEVFSSVDVLVVPSIWYENSPLVIYSAQACACPVIASDRGGMSEAVAHEQNGLLFQAGNAGDLAQAIDRLARDRSLLRKLAQGARTPKSIVEYAVDLESMYAEIIRERRAA